MDKKKKIMAGSLLFSGITEAQLDAVAAIAVNKTCRRGESIFFEGDEGTGFYMVAEGQVKIYKMSFDRSEERRVGKECRSRWSPYH